MDKAIVPVIGDSADDSKLLPWASSFGLRVEVEQLIAASRDLESVLTEAPEEIQNQELVQHLREAEHRASRAEDILSALEYYRIKGEVEQNERHDDEDHVDDDSKHRHDIGDGILLTAATDIQLFHRADREVALLPKPEAVSRAIEEHVVECHRIASNVCGALKLEKLDEKRLQIYKSTSWTDPREMSPFATEHKVHGRDQDRDCIISKLTSEESAAQNLSVVAIVGNGGVGKTTLAKVVCRDAAVNEHFDRTLWLHVSVYFNEAKITRELLQLLCGDRHEEISDMKELQNIIGYEIKSKRVLLVLDDMWEDNKKENWDVLLTPLITNDAKGNMVIITTRKPSVARMTGATHINLHGLKDEEFWPLFKECAFGDENHKGDRKLKDIGRKIAAKLKGYPLAAKSVGKLLNRKLDEKHWTRILHNSEWKDQEGGDDVIPALKISYNYLPRHLQKCFSYCSIFPKNQWYNAQWLVNIWIAQGFIPLADQYTLVEETGRRYLADLIDWGFFLSEPPRPSLLMHDLVHDLAQMVSSHESFTLEDLKRPAGDFKLIRHVTVITESAYYGQFDGTVLPNENFMQEFAETFCTLPKQELRTLMLFGAHDSGFASTFQHELSNEIRAVRVLNIEMVYPDLNMLIPNISAFINLRYLWLRSFYRGLKLQLPEAICKLYQLQVLDIKGCNPETVVPKGLHKLRNLRYFLAREQLHAQIASVGDLIFLQELMAFDVRKEHEFSIAQLEKLNDIRDSVSIYNLQNIESKEEASKAKLSDKHYLSSLQLSWNDMPTSMRKLKIIDGLEPPMCLKKLHIHGYNGSAPSWLDSTVRLTSLQSLHLEKCQFWFTLPSVQKLPLLQELHLINMRHLEKIPLGRGLKVLELSNMPSLKRFDVEMESGQPYENLEVIELRECNSLLNLPFQLCSSATQIEHMFPKLRSVQIRDCIDTKLPPFPIVDTTTVIDVFNACFNYMSFQLSPADDESGLCLELEGHRVSQIEILDETILRFSKMKNLKELEIRLFPEVRYLPWDGLQQMTALKKIKMIHCPKLFSSSPKLLMPTSIEEMEFDRCDITGKQLSSLMSNLPLLRTVKVQYCEGIRSLSVDRTFVDVHSTMEQGLWHIPPSSLVTLEKLDISLSDVRFSSKSGLGEFSSLKDIGIWKCPMLPSSMVSEAASTLPNGSLLPPSLLKLSITDVVDGLLARSKLASLTELHIHRSPLLISLDVCSCTALQELKIKECDNLQSIKGLEALILLAKLEISSCSKLASVQLHRSTSLQILTIDGCDALLTLDGSHSLTFLKEVSISRNPILSHVELNSCWALENLCVTRCHALASWQGFRSLTGIRSLLVSQSPGFVPAWKSAAEEMTSDGHNFSIPLESLDIDDIDVLSIPICRQLTSLKSLKIHGSLHTWSNKVDILLEHHESALQLLTSLKELTLSHFKHLESLPSTIHAFPLLQSLKIYECPCLASLPEEGLPPSLVEMDLDRCNNEVTELCRSIWKDGHFRLYIGKWEYLGSATL